MVHASSRPNHSPASVTAKKGTAHVPVSGTILGFIGADGKPDLTRHATFHLISARKGRLLGDLSGDLYVTVTSLVRYTWIPRRHDAEFCNQLRWKSNPMIRKFARFAGS